ncbi:hypothetical protein PybrP1_001227 [[Pythium] brassicae (nom. inval.)]|nr:hypothetical protein PybrP1_001227 [[Pythium] brassicae (nom. inval.)]
MSSSPGGSSAAGAGGGSRYAVFDGSTDFSLWRARVENELLRFHLLGYIRVRDYDGSQPFEYNGEEIPPKCPLVVVADDEEVKDEPVAAGAATSAGGAGKKRSRAAPVMRPGRLTRLDVIAERAEAMGILQRYLHPEVERAILGKNIFDSWATLCGMYGNHHVSDFYTVHRLLHAMRLGEKRDESAEDFLARLGLLMEQYAQIAGIPLTDPFRSMVLAHALPAAWAPMLDVWKAFKPYIPYAQLAEKVKFEHSAQLVLREQRDAALVSSKPATTGPTATDKDKVARKSSTLSVETKGSSKASASASLSSRPASGKEHASTPSSSKSSAQHEKGKATTTSSSSADKHYDSKRAADDSSSSRSYDKKRDDDRRGDRDDKREYKKEDRRGDKEYYSSTNGSSYDKRDAPYSSSSASGGYRDKRDYTSSVPYNKHMVCYYCLKIGHCFQACWFLRVDMENDSYTDPHKKYSACVTNERSAYMVQRIEQYVKDKTRGRGDKAAAATATTTTSSSSELAPHGYADPYALRSKSAFRDESTFGYGRSDAATHHQHHHNLSHAALPEAQLPLPPSYAQLASLRSQSMFRDAMPPPHQAYGYDDASPSSRLESDVERYKKRSRSVFGDESSLADKSRPRDPRSRSVFRPSDASGFRAADPNRRSVSPLPSSAHRAYSSGNVY